MLTRDSLGIGKCRLVDRLELCSCYQKPTSWSLNLSILASCTSLSALELEVDSASDFQNLFEGAPLILDNIVSLALKFYPEEGYSIEQTFRFPFPKVQKLDYTGTPDPALLSAIVRDCPSLSDVNLGLYASLWSGGNIPGTLARIPDELLAKVWCFAAAPIEMLYDLIERKTFHPRKLDLIRSGGSGNEGDFDEDWSRLWMVLVELDYLEDISCSYIPAEVFAFGMPKNLKSLVCVGSILPSFFPMSDLLQLEKMFRAHRAKVEKMFRAHPAKVSLGCLDVRAEPGPDAHPDWIAYRREQNFWSVVFRSIEEERNKRGVDRE